MRTDSNKNEEIISLKECKEFCQKYDLSDERIREINNNLVGLVDKVLNSYLEGLKDEGGI